MSINDEEIADTMEVKKSSPLLAEVAVAREEKLLPRPSARRLPRRRTNLALISMAIPGIVVLLVMAYLPMAGILIAFKNYLPFEGFFGSAWVGLQNFRFLFSTDESR